MDDLTKLDHTELLNEFEAALARMAEANLTPDKRRHRGDAYRIRAEIFHRLEAGTPPF